MLVPGLLVVLSEAFADFAGRIPHDRILTRVIAKIPSEYLRAQRTLLQPFEMPFKRLLHDVLEQGQATFACTERAAGPDPRQLFEDRFLRYGG